MDYQRKLLDELMGADRNRTPNDKPQQRMHWSDESVCKHYLVKFCPNELFVNTKADLGPCSKIHDEGLKQDYQKSDRKGTYGYEQDFLSALTKILNDLDRKARAHRERLSKGLKEDSPAPNNAENDAKMAALDQKIQEHLEKVEKCGEEGKVDEAQTLMRQVEIWKAEKEALRAAAQAGAEKRMEICETCGAFLVVGDTQKRTDSHLEGKQHTGYDMIRKAYEELKVSSLFSFFFLLFLLSFSLFFSLSLLLRQVSNRRSQLLPTGTIYLLCDSILKNPIKMIHFFVYASLKPSL